MSATTSSGGPTERDPWEILGVGPDAPLWQQHAAYRARARELHPDRAPPDERAAAEERMRQLNEAWQEIQSSGKAAPVAPPVEQTVDPRPPLRPPGWNPYPEPKPSHGCAIAAGLAALLVVLLIVGLAVGTSSGSGGTASPSTLPPNETAVICADLQAMTAANLAAQFSHQFPQYSEAAILRAIDVAARQRCPQELGG